MAKLFEVDVRYTDGTDELLLLSGKDYREAEAEAEAWTDHKKVAEVIKVVREVKRRDKR